MRLLLDEMFPGALAEQLCARGHDVEAVVAVPELAGLPDPLLFEAAQTRRRAIVTENVADFAPLDADCQGRGIAHWGLIYTTDRQYPRGHPRTLGALVRALDALLGELGPQADPAGLVRWL